MKKSFLLASVIIIGLLAGCAPVDNQLEQIIFEKSGIETNEDYQQYQGLKDGGELDENGYYENNDIHSLDEENEEEMAGSIHVTFADNRYWDIKYFIDAELTKMIDTDNCYLNPGDTIYLSEPISLNIYSNEYKLSSFIVYEYDIDGNNKGELYHSEQVDSVVYRIPDNFKGTEISIVPIGEYIDRSLNLSTYYINDENNVEELSHAGTWYVNDVECNEEAKISPIESYVLRFEFDTDNYFYVNSVPECFNDKEEGVIEFWEANPTDANEDYNVELHPYLKVVLKCSEDSKISINDGETINIKKRDIWTSPPLKYNDQITIDTVGECTITDGDYKHISIAKDPIKEGYRYELKVVKDVIEPNADSVVEITESVKVIFNTDDAYGTCEFLQGKKPLNDSSVTLKEGDIITLKYTLTDKDYEFAEPSTGINGWIHDHLWNKNTREVEITIKPDMDGKTIERSEYIQIVRKGE